MTFKDLAQKLRNTYMSLPSVVDALSNGFADMEECDVSADEVSFDNTGTTLASDNVEGAIKEAVTSETVTITRNETYTSEVFLSYVKKVGGFLSIYLVYGLNAEVPDNATLFTISGLTGYGSALSVSNNGAIHGVVVLDGSDVKILHQSGNGTSRFHLIVPIG